MNKKQIVTEKYNGFQAKHGLDYCEMPYIWVFAAALIFDNEDYLSQMPHSDEELVRTFLSLHNKGLFDFKRGRFTEKGTLLIEEAMTLIEN